MNTKNGKIPEIFKYLVSNTKMTHKSARECIIKDNISMLEYMMQNTEFIYLNSRFIETIVYENRTNAVECIFKNTKYMDWYIRNENIPTLCIQVASVDMLNILFEHGFTAPQNSMVSMIRHHRYDMMECAINLYRDRFEFNENIILYTATVEHFSIKALKMFSDMVTVNIDFFINLLTWNVSFNNIMKIYSAGIIDDINMHRIFQSTLDERMYDKCQHFIFYGYVVPEWTVFVKIASNDFDFVRMIIYTGYVFNEQHVNLIANTQFVDMNIVYMVMNNLQFNDITIIQPMDIISNNYYMHNHYIFMRMMKMGMTLNTGCIRFMIIQNMFNYIKTTCKHVSIEDIAGMIQTAKHYKKYAISMYLMGIKLKRQHFSNVV